MSVLFLQGYGALQELLMNMSFPLAVAQPFVYQMTSLLAMPSQSVWKYGLMNPLSQDKWQNTAI